MSLPFYFRAAAGCLPNPQLIGEPAKIAAMLCIPKKPLAA